MLQKKLMKKTKKVKQLEEELENKDRIHQETMNKMNEAYLQEIQKLKEEGKRLLVVCSIQLRFVCIDSIQNRNRSNLPK
jgi:S-adenosylmethionine:tRNA-ribosyltransferase-isomerase (queuine synthetase)